MVRQLRKVTRISPLQQPKLFHWQKFRFVKNKVKKGMDNATNSARLTRIGRIVDRTRKGPRTPSE